MKSSKATPQASAHRVSDSDSIRIVTVAYNPGEELERLLESIRHASRRRIRVVIADNGTQHGYVSSLAARFNVEIVTDGTNRGYGAGANLAAANLTEDWIVVANPDILFTPASLDAMIDAAAHLPDVGCLGPRLLNQDGSIYPSGRALPSIVRGSGHALLGKIWPGNPFSAAYHDQHDRDEIRRVGWLSGACLVLPRPAWEKLGGFDEDYFMFFEDVDLGARIQRAGLASYQIPQARVIHEQGSSWKARPARMIRAHHDSARLYLSRAYAAPWQAPLRWALRSGLKLREEIEVRRSQG